MIPSRYLGRYPVVTDAVKGDRVVDGVRCVGEEGGYGGVIAGMRGVREGIGEGTGDGREVPWRGEAGSPSARGDVGVKFVAAAPSPPSCRRAFPPRPAPRC